MTNHKQAIDLINSVWGRGGQIQQQCLNELTNIITYAAVIEKHKEAIDWLFLVNWQPQQLRN